MSDAGFRLRDGVRMPRKKPPPPAKPPVPAQRSSPDAQALLAKLMLRVADKHDDPAMRDAGERLGEIAKGRSQRLN
jgi:hypothetical protein